MTGVMCGGGKEHGLAAQCKPKIMEKRAGG